MRAYVAVTDPLWLQRLLLAHATEANFWQPRPARLKQHLGTPWIFKVRKSDRIGGFGFLSHYTVMPSGVAWEAFGEANGVGSLGEMLAQFARLRRSEVAPDDPVGCVVLSEVTILPPDVGVSVPLDWKRNTQRGQYYDLERGEGARVWAELTTFAKSEPKASPRLEVPGGHLNPSIYLPRRGQGAFRVMVMDAYDRRCAITGEKTLPVLEAAHIRPFRQAESHEVSNGILLRSDIHKLFDQGYVTVTPELTFRVSSRIRERFHNGLVYYDLHDRAIRVPTEASQRPDPKALAWHSNEVFRD